MYKWFLRPLVDHFREAAFFVKLSFRKYRMLGGYIEFGSPEASAACQLLVALYGRLLWRPL